PTRIAECTRPLSNALDIPESDIGFLPLDATEHLRAEVTRRLRGAEPSDEFMSSDHQGIVDWAASAVQQGIDPRVALFHERDRETGAAVVPINRVLPALWPMKDSGLISDLLICDTGCRHGVCLDFGFYSFDGTYHAEGVCQSFRW